MLTDYSIICTISISDVKQEQVSAVKADQKDVRQVTLLEKLKHESLVLKGQITLLKKLKHGSLALKGFI